MDGVTERRDVDLIGSLERALLHGGGTHRLADLVALLNAGRAQYWERGQGAVITELRDHPQYRELNVWLVAGDLGDCVALQPEIEEWARQHAARRVVGVGRDGWDRIACERMGFRKTGVALERWLDGG